MTIGSVVAIGPATCEKAPVPDWQERTGHTLQLVPSRSVADRNGEGRRLVRLSLVERVGMLGGWFNVREARAETRDGGSRAEVMAAGRLLSWRWLRRHAAQLLLDQRLRMMETLGYELVASDVAVRGPWDWLHDLVRRGLKASANDEAAGPGRTALHDALTRLGLGRRDIVDGISAVLGIHPTRMQHPDPETIDRVDRDELAVLLPFLLAHEDHEVREIGRRWIDGPTTIYELPKTMIEQWLSRDDALARTLAERLPREGLALVGPETLLRLARASRCAAVRDAAGVWVRRLG